MGRLDGPAGWADRWAIGEIETPAHRATLATWLIYAPNQSPAWSHYVVSVVHLRDIEGAPPAKLSRAGVTHEFLLFAVDPMANPTLGNVDSICPLRPINAACQFQVDTDEQAIKVAELAVMAIVRGQMPAEAASSYVGQKLWQEAIDQTAEHARAGGHPLPKEREN